MKDKQIPKKEKTELSATTLKLAVALQLKIEGYETVVFNKDIKTGSKSVVLDVFGEDYVGSTIAVYCVTKAKKAEERHLNDVACAILDGLGEDCLIAFAYPLKLISLVRNAIGLANRIYLIDGEGRVWCHYLGTPQYYTRPTRITMDELEMGATAQLVNRNTSRDTVSHDFYVV